MKKWSYLLFAASFLILGIQQTKAQTLANAVKFGVSGLPTLELQLEYERVIKKNMSFQIELIGAIPHAIPRAFTDPFLGMGSGDRYSISEWTKNSRMAFGLIPEFRFYPLRDNALRGFYIAPYIKARANIYNLKGNYKSQSAYAVGSFNALAITVGGGLSAGYQFVFGKKGGVVLDLGLGVGVDYHILKITAKSDYDGENYEVWAGHIDGAIDGIPVYGKAFAASTFEGSKVEAKGKMPFVGVRPAVSLGFAFH